SGLGSWCLGSIDEKRQIAVYTILFLCIGLSAAVFTRPLLDSLSIYPLHLRMLIAVAMVFPLGFFMGSFLPQGMKLLGHKNGPIALYWGLNGITSVIGSILAMIVQINLGLNAAFTFGMALYIIAAIMLFELKCGGGK